MGFNFSIFIFCLCFSSSAFATFSIIAKDKTTGEEGVAFASCIDPKYEVTSDLPDNIIYPGHGFGILLTQAKINEFEDIWYNTAEQIIYQPDKQYTAKIINSHLMNIDPIHSSKRQFLTIKTDKFGKSSIDVFTGMNVEKYKGSLSDKLIFAITSVKAQNNNGDIRCKDLKHTSEIAVQIERNLQLTHSMGTFLK